MKFAAVILAAGLSSRMDGFKPLLHIGGKSLLAHCHDLFSAVGVDEQVVVVGHHLPETVAEASLLGLTWCQNRDYRSGMFSSVKSGVSALAAGIDAFFLLPVDIPLIRPATLRAILAAYPDNTDAVIFPTFAGRRGHPPLIPSSLIPAILAYDGTGGLEGLLCRYRGIDLAVWDEGILLDADTPADLEGLRQRFRRRAIPSPEESLALAGLMIDAAGIAHGRLVAEVALVLAQALQRQGRRFDTDLLFAAALLHDIAKGYPRHEIKGAEILESLGLRELAAITAVHSDLGCPASGLITEQEIVCLADKVVSGSRRLRLQQRYDEKRALFAGNDEALRAIERRRNNALALADLFERRAGRRLDAILAEAGL
jgi:CTP:molybdopterin cytidylyltransferase MocA